MPHAGSIFFIWAGVRRWKILSVYHDELLIQVLNDKLVFHWSLHNLLGILTYILFSKGLWQARRGAM
jgi:hypothetical protein